ncbi:glycosyltransferase family 2 protein [Reyranella sp.]|uniref:glycosyltransferase family 2 protein n=1 Tax=Reyranella sp. TaxID=1929291 RepID=UPI003D09FD2D
MNIPEILPLSLVGLFILGQILYSLVLLVDLYLLSLPVDWVDPDEKIGIREEEYPYIVLFYPVLRELESTMRTTFTSLARLDYPANRYRIVAIPNSHDHATIASLKRLQESFSFVQILEVPPTADPSWQIVWDSWTANPNAYWWHTGVRARNRDLPPKKTRQLIYAFYHMANAFAHEPNLAINYIDADSCPPTDHLKAAVNGLRRYDVLQAQNVAGNMNASMAASWHALDHMVWDGYKYPHLSANGRQPYWVLGKGLYFRASDLLALGGFHPWVSIEDPEVGLRFWKSGKRLGIIASSLIEEVPETFREGISQRKRWTCGFFQALGSPLGALGFTPWERFKAWLVFLPCLSLSINAFGIPVGLWALWVWLTDEPTVMPGWALWLAAANFTAFVISLIPMYANVWRRTGLVFERWTDRTWYMLRVNPLLAMFWWLIWIVPLAIGFKMYISDGGLVWQRTKKINANEELISSQQKRAKSRGRLVGAD